MLFPNKQKPIIIGTEIYSRFALNELDLENALDSGFKDNFLGVDSAECYGDGSSEKAIGSFSSKEHPNFIVSTKFGHVNSHGTTQESFSVQSVEQQLKSSLQNLQRNCIDIYYFHSGSNEHFLQPDLWNFLQLQKSMGAIKDLGLSLKHELVKNQDYIQIDKASAYDISVLQTVLNPLHRHSLDYVIQAARSHGMTVVGRMPLAKGLIPKMSLEDLEEIISPSAEVKELITNYWKKFNLGEKSLVDAIKIGLALHWCLQKVDAVVLAHHSLEQLKMNSRVLDAILFDGNDVA
jgi:aryl-alcohol dehydrogenase-like predicted oxidoreductase